MGVFFRNVGQVAILAQGAYLVIIGEVSPALMIVGTILYGRVVSVSSNFAQAVISFRALKNKFEKMEVTIEKKEESTVQAVKGDMLIRKLVVTNSAGTKPVIKSISFEVLNGEFVMICGEPGSGKSALMASLCGIGNVTHGTIKFDDIKVTPQLFKRLNAYYSPDNSGLFLGTVFQNITLFEENTDQNLTRAINAAKKLGLHKYIDELSDGYNTMLCNDKISPSNSLEALIIASRVIYTDSKILLLDDPSKNLPLIFKRKLFEGLIEKKNNGATIVFSTQESSFPGVFDKVIVLESGVVKAYSTKENNISKLRV